MQSPFKIFRKHQKVALAAVTLMAMIAFGLGDVIRQMNGPSRSQREGKVIFETNIGNVTEMTLHHLTSDRRTLHRFIATAFERSHAEYEKLPYFAMITRQMVDEYGFGGVAEFDILHKWLYLHEARKLGIVVSDRQINDYIDQITARKLSKKKFNEVLRDMGISSKELFDLFREELEVVTARRLTFPAPLPSPEKYWEHFQQLNTQQKIAVAAVPVNSFTDKTGEPTDAQIAALFAKHQYDGESAFNGQFHPGFRQPQKVKLQYLEIGFADAEKKSHAAKPVTDKDIEEYYDANKATTIWMQEPPAAPVDDKTPIDPLLIPEEEARKPESEAGKGPALDRPDEGASDAKSEKPQTKDDASPTDPEKGSATEDAQRPDCVTAEDDAPDAVDEQPTAEKESAPEAEEPAKRPTSDDTEKTTEPEEKNATAPADAPGGKSGEDKPKIPAPPEPKFKPLDDDLRSRIRDTLKTMRAEQLMKDTAENARKAMGTVAESFADSKDIKLVDPDEKQLAELERRSATALRKIAEKLDMKYGETGLVSMSELADISGLGRAFDPESSMNLRGEMTTIVEQAFSTDGLCQAFESEAFSSARYVSWKVRDIPAHVPELTEPGVKEQVVSAWKRLEAQPVARKRAEELAERAKSSDKDFQAALADETVTGTSVGPSLAVFESGQFSFWQESAAPNALGQSRQPRVQLGNPSGVANPGRKFMQVVFDQLSEGEVGVALNDDATIYYVVKVLERRPADREEFKTAKLFDRGSAYASIAQFDLQFALQEHNERLREKYAIRIKDVPNRRGRPTSFDEE